MLTPAYVRGSIISGGGRPSGRVQSISIFFLKDQSISIGKANEVKQFAAEGTLTSPVVLFLQHLLDPSGKKEANEERSISLSW